MAAGPTEPFEGFDFTDFWDDDDYALDEYVCAPPTDELIASLEKELGHRFPASYVALMKMHCPTRSSHSSA